jgi:hypothetical protein
MAEVERSLAEMDALAERVVPARNGFDAMRHLLNSMEVSPQQRNDIEEYLNEPVGDIGAEVYSGSRTGRFRSGGYVNAQQIPASEIPHSLSTQVHEAMRRAVERESRIGGELFGGSIQTRHPPVPDIPAVLNVQGVPTLELGDKVRVGEISEPIPIYAGTGENRRLVGHWHPLNPGADEDPYEHTELSQRGLDLDDGQG